MISLSSVSYSQRIVVTADRSIDPVSVVMKLGSTRKSYGYVTVTVMVSPALVHGPLTVVVSLVGAAKCYSVDRCSSYQRWFSMSTR